MKNIALLFALIVCSLTSWGQPEIEWVREFDFGDFDKVWDLIQVDDGYVFACTREVRPGGTEDTLGFWVIGKLNLSGETLWLHEYQSSGRLLRLLANAEGGYSIAGSWTIIVNLDENGDSVSSASYLPEPPAGGVGALSLAPSDDSEWFFWADPNINEGHFLTAKVSPHGDVRWEVPYAYSSVYSAGIFGAAPGGGITVLYRVSQNNSALDYIDSNGNPQWTLDLDALGLNGTHTRLFPNTQILLISGYLLSVTRVDLNGNIIWNRNYGDGEFRYNARPDISESGESAIGVNDEESPSYHNRLYVTSANGDSLWSFQLPDSLRGALEFCRITSNAGVMLGVNPRDEWEGGIVKIVKIVAPIEAKVYPGISNTFPASIKLALAPNPFNPSTTISFSIPKSEHVSLVAHDLNGREVATLVDQRMEAGHHTQVFDGANLPSGIYFARLTAGHDMMTQKLLLVK